MDDFHLIRVGGGWNAIFDLSADMPVSLRLHTLNGRSHELLESRVLQAGNHSVPIQKKLNRGTYLVSFMGAGRTQTKHLIVK